MESGLSVLIVQISQTVSAVVMQSREMEIKELGEALSALCDFIPCSKTELRRWYDLAQEIIDNQIKGRNIGVPHFLWHFLSDADIRLKDEEYAVMQNGRMDVLHQHLRKGKEKCHPMTRFKC